MADEEHAPTARHGEAPTPATSSSSDANFRATFRWHSKHTICTIAAAVIFFGIIIAGIIMAFMRVGGSP